MYTYMRMHMHVQPPASGQLVHLVDVDVGRRPGRVEAHLVVADLEGVLSRAERRLGRPRPQLCGGAKLALRTFQVAKRMESAAEIVRRVVMTLGPQCLCRHETTLKTFP